MPWLWSTTESEAGQSAAGCRFGAIGAHSSRTMMLAEVRELFAAVPPSASRADYTTAIVEANALGKSTTSSRRLTSQRLGELYGLAPTLPLFRILRRLWSVDDGGRPLLLLLAALARDPLLRATTVAVLNLAPGEELLRQSVTMALRATVGERFNDANIDKIARNTSSTWSQSGHLDGRVRKLRRRVNATPAAVAFALWLGSLQGLAGEDLLHSTWNRALDLEPEALIAAALKAKQLDLIEARVGGGVIEIDPSRLDPRWSKEARRHG